MPPPSRLPPLSENDGKLACPLPCLTKKCPSQHPWISTPPRFPQKLFYEGKPFSLLLILFVLISFRSDFPPKLLRHDPPLSPNPPDALILAPPPSSFLPFNVFLAFPFLGRPYCLRSPLRVNLSSTFPPCRR